MKAFVRLAKGERQNIGIYTDMTAKSRQTAVKGGL
jgi:hypothetical protein